MRLIVHSSLGGSGPEEWVEDVLNGENVAELAIQDVLLPPHAIATEMVAWPRAEEF
ncbi:MAG: hypothetical protein ACWGPS_05115 [Candidatus Promineifilaceae bacterium]